MLPNGSKKVALKLKEREEGFDVKSIPHARLNEYNALYDSNMRHYFENPRVQKLLYETGQIDKYGRVINLEKNKSKIHILEREFKEAERQEELRHKEEIDMRYRVQRKRFTELERTRKLEKLNELKNDRKLSEEIMKSMRLSSSSYSSPGSRSVVNRSSFESSFEPNQSAGEQRGNTTRSLSKSRS